MRHRNVPLAEKFKPCESPEEAAKRGVREQLGAAIENKEENIKVKWSGRLEEEEKSSQSFPGLVTRYKFYEVDASVRGLPKVSFKTQEQENGKVKETHHWEVTT